MAIKDRIPEPLLTLQAKIGQDDISGAAAEMAYRFFLAIFPLFLFISAVGGFAAESFGIPNPTDRIMNALGNSLPSDSAEVLRRELNNVLTSRNSTLVSIGAIGALWASMSGMNTVMKGLNRAMEVRETRNFVQRTLLSLVLTCLGSVAIIGAFVLFVSGQVAANSIARDVGLGSEGHLLISVVRWPIAIAMLLLAVDIIFWAAPNVRLPFAWITPGAIMAVAVWLVCSVGFGVYVSHFGSYGATYGALGGVVIFLIWLYLSAFILLLGAEINALIAFEAKKVPPADVAVAQGKPAAVRDDVEASRGTAAAVHEAPGSNRTQDGAPQPRSRAFVPPSDDMAGTSDGVRDPGPHHGLVTITSILLAVLAFWRLSTREPQEAR